MAVRRLSAPSAASVRALGVLATALAMLPADGTAQAPTCEPAAVVDLADAWALRLRVAQLDGRADPGSLTIRRPSLERKVRMCTDSRDVPPDSLVAAPFGDIHAALLPLRMRSLFNSAYPLNVNTGGVWAGRGWSASIEWGGTASWGPLHMALYPLVAWQENTEFATREVDRPDTSPLAYPGHAIIDWPQRHGEEEFWTILPGQSSIRLAHWGATAGVSTENLWLGPAQRAPLMMGSSAPGFPHVFIGTDRPAHIGIGRLEAQFFWGRLTESDHFDADTANDHNLLVGSTVTFEPAFARGLFLGLHRSIMFGWPDDWSPLDYVAIPYTGLRDNPPNDNKLLAIFARWVLQDARAEFYAEWGREDGWGDWLDLLKELNHSQAWVLGFQKLGTWDGATLRWWGELAHLEGSMSVRSGRGAVTMYLHSERVQGYTHRGQLLGAWVGPGSNSQILGVDRMAGERLTGIAIERVRFDADAYYNVWARFYAHNGHDVSLGAWLRHVEPLPGGLRLAGQLSAARRQNRNFVRFTGAQPPELGAETNLHLDVEVRWMPGARRR